MLIQVVFAGLIHNNIFYSSKVDQKLEGLSIDAPSHLKNCSKFLQGSSAIL